MFRHIELSLILFFLWTFRQIINFKCLIISPEKRNACVRPETYFQLTVALLLGYLIHELIKLVVISRTFIDNTVVSFLIIIPTRLRTKFHFLRSVKSIFSVALFPGIGIFPMSRNNTFETSDFADPRFFFWSSEGVSLSATVFLWKKLLRNMKQMFSIQSVCIFPPFDCRKIKEQICERRNLLDIKLIFKSIAFMKPVSINSNTNCLRPSEIP